MTRVWNWYKWEHYKDVGLEKKYKNIADKKTIDMEWIALEIEGHLLYHTLVKSDRVVERSGLSQFLKMGHGIMQKWRPIRD